VSGPPGGRLEPWLLTAAAAAAIMAVLRPDLYADIVRQAVSAAVGHH
jgi:hypothetical protein